MSERPWYRRYGSDFIAGTLGLTLEEKGAYSIILDLIYDHGRPIADDARYIAGVCGCSTRKWTAIRARLVEAGKIVIIDGQIGNVRALRELENDAKTSRKRAENGSKGGDKTAENRLGRNEINGMGPAKKQPRARVPFPEPEPEKKETPIPLRGLVPQPAGKGAYLDPGWYPKPEALVWATTKLGSTERALTELAKFRDYWAAASGQAARKRDWDAAFRVWCSKAAEFERRPPPTSRPPPRRDPFAAMHDQLLEARNGQQQQPFDLDADDATAALFRPRLVYAGGDSG